MKLIGEKRARARIQEALRNLLDPNTRISEHIAFDVHFKHQGGDFDTSTSFSVHHFIEPSLPDRSLIGWAAANKLHPWVGLAAPILVCLLSLDVVSWC